MNETDSVLTTKCNNICIACLRTTNDLFPMCIELNIEYKKFVEMVTDDTKYTEMMICNVCCWQFRRHLNFKRQCQSAWTMLKDAAIMDFQSLPFNQNLALCYNLETTKTEIHHFREHAYSRRKNLVKPSVNKSEVNVSPVNNLQVNVSPVNNLQVNGSPVNNLQVNGSSENLLDEDLFDDFNNDDEVPLVKLKDMKRSKKRKKRKSVPENDEMLSEQPEDQEMPSRRPKKELKEGFTSRMVQETDEYFVIKLTKEQVLQEMEEKSKKENYVQSPFKCEKCVKGFNFQDVLRTHLEKHTMEVGSFQCEMCFQYCRSAVSLRGHVKSHTTRYKCKLCGVVRLSRQHLLEHHAITHTRQAVTYSCDSCQFNTNKRTVMQRHVKSHATSEPHACEQCGKLFKSIDSLRVHTMRHDKTSRLQCHCGVSFLYQSLLRRHVTRVHERREYYCVECDAQFKSNESLRLHYKKAKKHRDSSSFKHLCPQCPVRCFTASALGAHQASAHGAPRSHACPLCRRLYSSRDALRAHAWRVHAHRHNGKAS